MKKINLPGILYWHPLLYRLIVRWMYGTQFRERYQRVAEQVRGESVLDICCGDAYLARFLFDFDYTGIDQNNHFIESAQHWWANNNAMDQEKHNPSGINKKKTFKVADVKHDPFPEADTVIIMASLYQFIPHHELIITKALNAARQRLIISEPIQNFASSSNPFISWIASHAANPGDHPPDKRFNRQSLIELYDQYQVDEIIEAGRELIGIIDK